MANDLKAKQEILDIIAKALRFGTTNVPEEFLNKIQLVYIVNPSQEALGKRKKIITTQFTSEVTPVSRQLYTVTSGKTLFITDVHVDASVASANFILRDETTDAGQSPVRIIHDLVVQARDVLYTTPIEYTAGVRFEGGDMTASCFYTITVNGWEE